MIMTLLKLGFLLVSYFGWWEFFRRKCRINVYFAPFYTIACHFCVLFAAGILNYLKDATVLLWLGGLVLAADSLRKEKTKVFRPYFESGYLCCAVLLAMAALYTRDKMFSQIDNFTHWATVVRNMLSTDRFPSHLDSAVGFTSYPLGSSAIIYYFCRMSSVSEDMQMLAQVFMMLCCILPVFAFAKKNSIMSTALTFVVSVFWLQYNVPITELLVDTLLPLAGMATIAFLYHSYRAQKEEPELSPYMALPLMLWTLNIKHAAALYVVGAFVLLCVIKGKEKQGKKRLCYIGLALLAARSLWSRHCSYMNPGASMGPHAMSVSWFSKILKEKTVKNVLDITQDFVEFVVTRREVLWILAWIVLLVILSWLLKYGGRKSRKRFAVGIAAMYAVYAVGVLGMYIFSMPAGEGLMSLDRYMKSGDVAIYYVLLVLAVSILGNADSGRKRGIMAGGVLLLLLAAAGCWFQTGKYANTELMRCTAEERQRLEGPIDEFGIAKRRSYLICVPQEESSHEYEFRQYLWRYRMESSAVHQIVVTEKSQLDIETMYDYVIVLDQENAVIREWLQEHYPDRLDSVVVRYWIDVT